MRCWAPTASATRPSTGGTCCRPSWETRKLGGHVEVVLGPQLIALPFGPPRIGEGTKIDNQVQVVHNCQIGKHNILVFPSGDRRQQQHRRLRGHRRAGGDSRSRAHWPEFREALHRRRMAGGPRTHGPSWHQPDRADRARKHLGKFFGGARYSSSALAAAPAPRPSASGTTTDRKYSIAARRPAFADSPSPSPASIARPSRSISQPAVRTAVIVISG